MMTSYSSSIVIGQGRRRDVTSEPEQCKQAPIGQFRIVGGAKSLETSPECHNTIQKDEMK